MSYLETAGIALDNAENELRGLGPFSTADHDPAELVALANYYVAREAFAGRVDAALEGLGDDPGEYIATEYGPRVGFTFDDREPMFEGSYAIHRANNAPSYAQPRGLPLRVSGLHVTIEPFEGDRLRVVAALIAAGVVDGWDGDETAPDGFTDAFSGYGWISVR